MTTRTKRPAEFTGHPMSFPTPFVVRAVVTHVVDGDTIDALLDLGLGVYTHETIRVRGIDTPEVVGGTRAAGLAAKLRTTELLANAQVRLALYPDEVTFGRYVADVAYWTDTAWHDLAATLRTEGHTA